jgi:hypothetical protein
MFLRFVVVERDARSGSLRGVIRAASELQEAGALEAYQEKALEEAYAWLNDHLPVPPALGHRGPRGRTQAISWFRASAAEAIDRVRGIVAILHDCGVPVEMVKTANPGRVIYEDEWQVVAIPMRDRNASFR